ncbi:MAG: MFS transporter [Candidatus Rokuibacteriota bacterium]|nr:MAG: MFS transporter [Candidatus Rokubacteria bacterium]
MPEAVLSEQRRVPVSAAFGLERNIVVVSVAIFLLALGENLWKRFLPKYLEILGAPITAIGLFGTCEDFLDGVYQYPGGWISDRYGRRRALLLFVALAMVGYGLYWLAPSWPFVFAGLLFVMAWSSMASPPLFAVVGDALPKERRALGFTVQSILKRVPIAVAPTLGGLAIAEYGLRNGAHLGLGLTVGLAAIALIVLGRIDLPVKTDPVPTHIVAVWRSLPTALRWLLASDIFIRTCEGLVDVFLVLYAINVIGVSAPTYGLLVGVQMTTAIVSYLPVARVADRLGRKPFVIATFVAFALFPVAVVLARSFAMLVAAFVVGGLREIGEPARKALIVDLVQPTIRARSIGLYYLVRSLAIAPAAFIGGLLWRVTPALPFWVAGAIGLVGVITFTVTVDERDAG